MTQIPQFLKYDEGVFVLLTGTESYQPAENGGRVYAIPAEGDRSAVTVTVFPFALVRDHVGYGWSLRGASRATLWAAERPSDAEAALLHDRLGE